MTTTRTVLYVVAADGDDGGLERLEASFDVAVAEGSIDALKRLRTRSVPDCIVVPTALPDLSLDAFLAEVRRTTPPPAVVVVGDPPDDPAAAGALTEADAYLPADRGDRLVGPVSRLLAERQVDRAIARHERLSRAVARIAVDAARAGDRAAIEAAFHDRLVEDDWYRHVWVARRDGDDGLDVALPTTGRLGEDELATLTGDDDVDFVDRALDLGRVVSTRADVATRSAAGVSPTGTPDGGSDVTLATAAVPFVWEGQVLGLGLLSTDRADAFDGTERELLADVGAILGHALWARRSEPVAGPPTTGRGMENLVHDLRNPLGIARSHLEIAREDGDPESLDRVAAAIDRMVDTVDRVAMGVGGEPGIDAEPGELAEAADTAWESIQAESASLAVESATIEADHELLVRLLANLFQNAVDHGGEGVDVRVGPTTGGFYVEDDGPGIPADEREAVVERGYSTSEDGLGIGLSIVKDVADAHGWTLTVSEGDGGGARFELSGVERVEERETP